MSKGLRYCSLLVVAGTLLLAQAATAAEGPSRNLVDVTWLGQHLDDPNILILDASAAQAYAAQHIRGSVSVTVFDYGGRETPRAETQRTYQAWGISPGKRIILYDEGGTFMAARLFFSLVHHGFPAEDLAVLDGGLAKWQAAGLPVTKDATPPPPAGTFVIARIDEDVRVRLPEVLKGSGDPAGTALVEALGPDWHFGQTAVFDRAGHIPNSVLLPSADLFNADKTFKSPEDLRRMLRYLNVRPEQQVYTYCGGGFAAAVPFFALKYLLGYPNVKLFSESEMGWLGDERGLPYWTYDAPHLMRDTGWLQWSGGQRIRMYLGAPVSIVDIRAPEAYAEGHVPFALNIPAGTFRSHTGNPAHLAEMLGAAGVDASLEAVVVSGAGLTKDAALAFAMLEKVGQKKVSVFMDPMDRWTQLGFQLAKTPTVVGPRKSPMDTAIQPGPYRAEPRSGVVVTDPKGSQGVYPKVFIASGGSMPATPPDGTVVHVPYSDLLNTDGTPRAAKELWNILSKAGVPRYAEIVCVSDDPGEAAVVYFVLKLMGFPDVKVQVS